MSTTDTIRRCIDRCARAKDGRGTWQAEASLRQSLAPHGQPSELRHYIAIDVAAAARRIGEWLRDWRAPT